MGKKKLYRGTIETFIFQLLSEHGKLHGYEISKQIKALTAGELVVSESALYPALHRLESDGFLTATVTNMGQRLRKYYSLTKSGKTEAKNYLADLQDFIVVMQGLISPKLARS